MNFDHTGPCEKDCDCDRGKTKKVSWEKEFKKKYWGVIKEVDYRSEVDFEKLYKVNKHFISQQISLAKKAMGKVLKEYINKHECDFGCGYEAGLEGSCLETTTEALGKLHKFINNYLEREKCQRG